MYIFSDRSSFFSVLALVLLLSSKAAQAQDCEVPGDGATDAELESYYACIDGDGGSDGLGGGSGGGSEPDSEIEPPPVVVPVPDPTPEAEAPGVFVIGSIASRLADNARETLTQQDGDAVNEAASRLERLSEALSAPLSEASVLELKAAEKSFAESVSATVRAIENSDYEALYDHYAGLALADKERDSADGLFPEINFLRRAVELYPFDDGLYDAFMTSVGNVRSGSTWNASAEDIANGDVPVGSIDESPTGATAAYVYATNLLLEREVILATRARANANSFAAATINGQTYKADGTAFQIYFDDPDDFATSPVLREAIRVQGDIVQRAVNIDHIKNTVKAFADNKPQLVFVASTEKEDDDDETVVSYDFTIESSSLDIISDLIEELAQDSPQIEASVIDIESRDDAAVINDNQRRNAPSQTKQPTEIAASTKSLSRRLEIRISTSRSPFRRIAALKSGAALQANSSDSERRSQNADNSAAAVVNLLADAVVDNSLFQSAPVNPSDLEGNSQLLSLAPQSGDSEERFSVVTTNVVAPSGLSSLRGIDLGAVVTTDSAGNEIEIGGVSINNLATTTSSATGTGESLAEWLSGGAAQDQLNQSFAKSKNAMRSAAALTQQAQRRFIPLMTGELYAVSSKFPEGLNTLADGTMLAVRSRLGGRLVAAPLDLALLETSFASLGELVYNAPFAQLQVIQDDQIVLSAAPSLAGVRASESNDSGNSVWSFPEEGDESNLDYVLEVRHPAGITEILQPLMLDTALIRSVNSMEGLSLSVDRATGIIDVSGTKFRPSYTTSALTGGETIYLNSTGDEEGVAYYLADVNADGIEDVTVYTALGKQVLYGVAIP